LENFTTESNEPLLNIDHPMQFWRAEDGKDLLSVYSIMFDDGTIYDSGKLQRFRSEDLFPREEILDYADKVLKLNKG
jgi:hypothetical protein